jgi:hypothetical protein
MSNYEYVSLAAIPYDQAEDAFSRLEARHSIADLIEEEFLEFKARHNEMQFMHKCSVPPTKEALTNLIAACLAYQRNLGWQETTLI